MPSDMVMVSGATLSPTDLQNASLLSLLIRSKISWIQSKLDAIIWECYVTIVSGRGEEVGGDEEEVGGNEEEVGGNERGGGW